MALPTVSVNGVRYAPVDQLTCLEIADLPSDRKMVVIAGPRCSGKTTELIQLAAEHRYCIVCHNGEKARCLQKRAAELGLEIPEPISYGQFIDHRHSFRDPESGYLIDDVEYFLAVMAKPLKVFGFSYSVGERTPSPVQPDDSEPHTHSFKINQYPTDSVEGRVPPPETKAKWLFQAIDPVGSEVDPASDRPSIYVLETYNESKGEWVEVQRAQSRERALVMFRNAQLTFDGRRRRLRTYQWVRTEYCG